MEFRGFDTEAFKGNCKLLACSNGAYVESDDTLRLLDFLWDNALSPSEGYNFFFNVDYDFGVIVKQYVVNNFREVRMGYRKALELKREIKRKLDSGLEVDKSEWSLLDRFNHVEHLQIEKYELKYIKDKGFMLRKGRKRKFFFDVANFLSVEGEHISLQKASQLLLNESKNDEELGLDRKAIGEVEGYYEEHREEIIKYCVQDCKLTAQLGRKVVEGFSDLGFQFPAKPYSKATISKEWLSSHVEYMKSQEYYAKIMLLPYASAIKKSFRGGIIRLFGIGKYNDITEYDINSAYPFAISQLTSLEDAQVTTNKEDMGKCDYEFYLIEAKDWTILGLKVKNGVKCIVEDEVFNDNTINEIIYCVTSRPVSRWVTKWDKQILDLFGVEYKIFDYFGIKTTGKKLFPQIEKLYDAKREIKQKFGKHSVQYWGIKIVLNGIYGIFAQRKPHISKYTNFIFASHITGLCRYLIMSKVYEKQKQGAQPLMINTDGVYFINDSKPDTTSNALGGFEVNRLRQLVVFGNGVYYKDDGANSALKKRGFPTLTIDMLQTDNNIIVLKEKRPVTVYEGVIQSKPTLIGDFVEREKVFSLFNLERKYSMEYSLISISFRELWLFSYPLHVKTVTI